MKTYEQPKIRARYEKDMNNLICYIVLRRLVQWRKYNFRKHFQSEKSRDMTNLHAFIKVSWYDLLVSYFSPMYLYGINTNALHLTFSRAKC